MTFFWKQRKKNKIIFPPTLHQSHFSLLCNLFSVSRNCFPYNALARIIFGECPNPKIPQASRTSSLLTSFGWPSAHEFILLEAWKMKSFRKKIPSESHDTLERCLLVWCAVWQICTLKWWWGGFQECIVFLLHLHNLPTKIDFLLPKTWEKEKGKIIWAHCL